MEYQIEQEEVGKRLDVFVAEQNLGITRSYIKTLITKGNILVNNGQVKSGYALKKQDKIVVEIPPDELADIIPQDIGVTIVYEDEDILIVDKEKGMVVHPAIGNYTGTLVNALMYSHGNCLSNINGVIRPGIVHRIDKDTSGILVIAKNDNAHKELSKQFKEHSIHRAYIALVKGIVKEDEMTISLPIGRSNKDRKKMAVTNLHAKKAITHIRVLKRFYESGVTLVEATLETGRTHQIRVHMAYLGHPLVGDEVYGKKEGKWKVQGQMLHAAMLGLIHPTTGNYVEYTSALPKEFEELLQRLENKEEGTK